MPRRDDALYLDMLVACENMLDFVEGHTFESFAASKLVQSAVVRELQVLGEAARHISDAGRQKHQDIPWKAISGMRNRLVHEYFDIRVDVVWETLQHDIPPLLELLRFINQS
jgi:uncharacterized protein with HEPN domain